MATKYNSNTKTLKYIDNYKPKCFKVEFTKNASELHKKYKDSCPQNLSNFTKHGEKIWGDKNIDWQKNTCFKFIKDYNEIAKKKQFNKNDLEKIKKILSFVDDKKERYKACFENRQNFVSECGRRQPGRDASVDSHVGAITKMKNYFNICNEQITLLKRIKTQIDERIKKEKNAIKKTLAKNRKIKDSQKKNKKDVERIEKNKKVIEEKKKTIQKLKEEKNETEKVGNVTKKILSNISNNEMSTYVETTAKAHKKNLDMLKIYNLKLKETMKNNLNILKSYKQHIIEDKKISGDLLVVDDTTVKILNAILVIHDAVTNLLNDLIKYQKKFGPAASAKLKKKINTLKTKLKDLKKNSNLKSNNFIKKYIVNFRNMLTKLDEFVCKKIWAFLLSPDYNIELGEYIFNSINHIYKLKELIYHPLLVQVSLPTHISSIKNVTDKYKSFLHIFKTVKILNMKYDIMLRINDKKLNKRMIEIYNEIEKQVEKFGQDLMYTTSDLIKLFKPGFDKEPKNIHLLVTAFGVIAGEISMKIDELNEKK